MLTYASGLPFRESKLTRLLQHSLGVHSATAMVATLAPTDAAAGTRSPPLQHSLGVHTLAPTDAAAGTVTFFPLCSTLCATAMVANFTALLVQGCK